MFTPVETTVGALLLHQAATGFLFKNGNVLGASGLLREAMLASSQRGVLFISGMAAAFTLITYTVPQLVPAYPAINSLQSMAVSIATGVLTGTGTKVCFFVPLDIDIWLRQGFSSGRVAPQDTCCVGSHDSIPVSASLILRPLVCENTLELSFASRTRVARFRTGLKRTTLSTASSAFNGVVLWRKLRCIVTTLEFFS